MLTSCDVLIAGFDAPQTACLIVAKRVKGLIRCMQIVGRCMRTAPGKTAAVVHDHTGMMLAVGMELECHWRIGFNELALAVMRRASMRQKLESIAPVDDHLAYVDRDLLPRDYRPEIELWANVCRWTADRVGIAWEPDSRHWHRCAQGSPEHRAYWQTVMNYDALTGGRVKLAHIRRVPFFASESCPRAVAEGLERRIDEFRRSRDADRARSQSSLRGTAGSDRNPPVGAGSDWQPP